MTVRVIDSHCHLQDEKFADDREEVFERALHEGVGLLVPGYDRDSSEKAVGFAESHPLTWALVGVHPHDAKHFSQEDLVLLRAWADRPRVVGIGEIGLDYHYNLSDPKAQREAFSAQLELARQLQLPVSVHTRDAQADTWQAMRWSGPERGVIHCFTGTVEFARQVLDFGWYISFSGVITFKAARELLAVVQLVPMDRLLIETDSPYLSPAPWRGQRNEPLRVIRVAEVVAAQKNCSTEEVFAATVENVRRLFCVPQEVEKTGHIGEF
jgi:TatD DNase family protein